MADGDATTLEEVLDQVCGAEEDGRERKSLDAILDAVGHRSFGPILVVTGLVMLAPVIGDIPGVPSILGLVVVLTAVQLVVHREHIWLPGWMLRRTVPRSKLDKTVRWLRPVARFLDKISSERLRFLVRRPGKLAIGVAAIAISLATPAMELVPFSANVAGAAITAFGVALVARDGLMALVAFAFTTTVAVILVRSFLL